MLFRKTFVTKISITTIYLLHTNTGVGGGGAAGASATPKLLIRWKSGENFREIAVRVL